MHRSLEQIRLPSSSSGRRSIGRVQNCNTRLVRQIKNYRLPYWLKAKCFWSSILHPVMSYQSNASGSEVSSAWHEGHGSPRFIPKCSVLLWNTEISFESCCKKAFLKFTKNGNIPKTWVGGRRSTEGHWEIIPPPRKLREIHVAFILYINSSCILKQETWAIITVQANHISLLYFCTAGNSFGYEFMAEDSFKYLPH